MPVASLGDAKPGDLVAFGTPVNHIGIYAGGGSMVVAPHTGDVVKIQPIRLQPVAIRRVLDDPNDQVSNVMQRWSLSTQRAVGASTTSEPGTYDALFRSAGARYGLAPELLAAVARQESSFDPQAVSPAGAQGLMQLMPGTASSLGVDPFNPAEAIDGAARLLSSHVARFGSVELALAAYNAGPSAVVRHGGVPPFQETRDYVTSILRSVAGRDTAANELGFTAIARRPITISARRGDISMDSSLDEPASAFSSPSAPAATSAPQPAAGTIVNTAISAPITTVTSPPDSLPPAAVTVAPKTPSTTTTSTTTTTPATTTGLTASTGTTAVPSATTGTPAKPEIQLPDASAEVTTTKRGAWGPNTQTQVESRGGSKTTSWESLGYLKPAEPADVTALVPKAKGQVAIGVLRVLQNATAAQLASKEFRQTLNDVNRDALGDLGAPDVIAVDPAQDPTPVSATPSNPKGGVQTAGATNGTSSTPTTTKTNAVSGTGTVTSAPTTTTSGAVAARLLAT